MLQSFMMSFKLEMNQVPKIDVGSEVYMLRYNLMREENDEYLDACRQGDLVEVADALGDQLYIFVWYDFKTRSTTQN
ncbi:MAG: hypothetical protein CM15mP23_09920 [Cryomorphaceae bacterium]|nr:MAG: hypothetical protein CM15mP23_09920 [Cryomorphaceae bacterium]